MSRVLQIAWRFVTLDWWVVRACAFPYPKGYGTYNIRRRMVLDTGLTKEYAAEICREMNYG